MRGDLAREVVAEAADLDQPLERLGIFVEQRKVGRSPADRLDDSKQPRQHDLPLARRPRLDPRDGSEDSRQQRRKPAPPEFVEAPEVRGLAQLEQHAGRGGRIGEAEAREVFLHLQHGGLVGPQRLEARDGSALRGTAAAQHHVAEVAR